MGGGGGGGKVQGGGGWEEAEVKVGVGLEVNVGAIISCGV